MKCSVCGEILTAQKVIPAKGHTEETVPGYAATCTTDGLTDGVKCSVCNETLTAQKVISAKGHTEETVPGYAATFTAPGLTDGVKCSVCGEILIAQEVIPALKHTEETVPGYAATCTTDGLTDGVKCSVCGEILIAQKVIPAKGHTEETVPGYAATCTTDGLTDGVKCSVCGETLTAQEVISAKGHSFVNGSCTACGETDPDYSKPSVVPTLGLKYPTVSFEDVIIMNVYYSAENIQDVVDMGLVTFAEKPEVADIALAETKISGYTPDGALYISSTEGIAPKDLGDDIYFAIYAELADGTYAYSKVASYSPKTYAMNQLGTGSSKMRPLVAAMLNYGAAAQNYFKYNLDNPINGTMSEDQLALVEAYNDSMTTPVTQPSGTKVSNFVNDKTYTKRYPTISFEGAFCINYYFQPSLAVKGDVTMYVWTAEAFEAAETLTKENATSAVKMTLTESGEYLGVVGGIAAKDLDKVAYVSFVYSDGTTEHCGGVVAYSIGAYCKSQAATTGTLSDLAKACAVYGYYAKQLFG